MLAEQNLRSRQRNSIIRTNTFVLLDLVVFDAGFAAGQVRGGRRRWAALCVTIGRILFAELWSVCDAKARFP